MSNSPAHILLVDDTKSHREMFSKSLEAQGFRVRQAEHGQHGLEILRDQQVDLVLLDIDMAPYMDGFEMLKRLREEFPPEDLPVLMLTDFNTENNVIQAINLGATDFLAKSTPPTVILARVTQYLALHKARRAEKEFEQFNRATEGDPAPVGEHPIWKSVLDEAARLARGRCDVFIHGETGSGKEHIARTIHTSSGREGAFIAINCGVIRQEWLISYLFGHGRGSFSGAIGSNPGRIREADGGTLFLDEIAEMNAECQGAMLRVLDDKVVDPLGGAPAAVDVLIVSATNKDLEAEVKAGRFREDLFYRLHADLPLRTPALRERKSDIPLLAKHFFEAACAKHNKRLQLGEEALRRLEEYSWPGNVRELKSKMERAVLLARRPVVTPEDLPPLVEKLPAQEQPPPTTNGVSTARTFRELKEECDRRQHALIQEALQEEVTISAAARRVGVMRGTFVTRAQKYGLLPTPNAKPKSKSKATPKRTGTEGKKLPSAKTRKSAKSAKPSTATQKKKARSKKSSSHETPLKASRKPTKKSKSKR